MFLPTIIRYYDYILKIVFNSIPKPYPNSLP